MATAPVSSRPRERKSALLPVGHGVSYRYRPREEWIGAPVPALIPLEIFDRVQAKLAQNQQCSARNNTHFPYLLRALVRCGHCRLGTTARTMAPGGQTYYVCQGRSNALRRAQGQRCMARYIPGRALDDLVWQDLCTLLLEPEHLATALRRAHGGHWLPQDLQARQATLRHALTQLDTSQQRLLDAYLASVLTLPVFERKQQELTRRQEALQRQQRQLDVAAHQHLTLSSVAQSLEAFCAQVRDGLREATFAQRRALVELLIDRVIVTDGEVEIRYVIPTTCHGPPIEFSHLRVDYLNLPAALVAPQWSSVLRFGPLAVAPMRRDHLDAQLGRFSVQRVGVASTVANQALRQDLDEARVERGGDQRDFMRRCRGGADAERKARAIRQRHELGPFAALGRTHTPAPFSPR